MKFISFCKYNLLFALLLGNAVHGMDPYHHGYHRSDSPTPLETVAAVGLVAAAAYGFYKLCDWLFTKTDEQILKEAKECLAQSYDNTYKQVSMIKNELGGIPDSTKEQQKLIRSIDEDFLYEYAIKKYYMRVGGRTFGEYAQQVAQAGQMAQNRAESLRKKVPHSSIINSLEKISQELGQLHIEIVFVAEFVREHNSYFELFELESYLLSAYEFEIASLSNYAANPPYLREALRMAVMKKAANERVSYPYMKYSEHIERDLKNLKYRIDSLRNSYHNRMKGAHLLLQHLDSIYNVVISEDAYRQELRDYKKEMLERERIAAEKAKAAAAAAQAHAAHMQAQAMQQQAYELQKQNQLQQQQNHILAAQGPTRVNVYL
jgi:hypothetical protein